MAGLYAHDQGILPRQVGHSIALFPPTPLCCDVAKPGKGKILEIKTELREGLLHYSEERLRTAN
ncbi:UNVERIFIED_CONTAM: hypothetical protein FKN15_028243 [Acipenser sinensis]